MVKETDQNGYDQFMTEVSILTTQGVDAAIQKFLKRHKLKTQKGATGLDTHWVFAQHVIAEFPALDDQGNMVNSSYSYPLKESLKKTVEDAIIHNGPVFIAVYASADSEHFPGLVRVVILNAVLEFLERNKDDAIQFYNGLLPKK